VIIGNRLLTLANEEIIKPYMTGFTVYIKTLSGLMLRIMINKSNIVFISLNRFIDALDKKRSCK
jgi:hypothetical protein